MKRNYGGDRQIHGPTFVRLNALALGRLSPKVNLINHRSRVPLNLLIEFFLRPPLYNSCKLRYKSLGLESVTRKLDLAALGVFITFAHKQNVITKVKGKENEYKLMHDVLVCIHSMWSKSCIIHVLPWSMSSKTSIYESIILSASIGSKTR